MKKDKKKQQHNIGDSCEYRMDYDNEVSDGNSLLDDACISRWERNRRKRVIKKTKVLLRAIDILFAVSQNSCPYVKKSNIDKIECQNDIVYDDGLPNICKLDFYREKSNEKQPAIIIIHGGGFTAGDKKYRKGRAQFFALNGFSVFCINYGLAPESIFPEPITHIVTAANFIYDNADKFNIDNSRILVDGDSAGAYYAAMLAAFNGNMQMKSVFGCAPKFKFFGAMLNCGIYDMDTVYKTHYPLDIDDGVVLSMTGVRSRELDRYKYKDVCTPITFVNSDFPPTFLIYSDNDAFCNGQGDVMLAKFGELGIYHEFYCARHITSNHCFSLTWDGEDASAANELTLSFAKRLANDKIKL